jgi:hypothetical protein
MVSPVRPAEGNDNSGTVAEVRIARQDVPTNILLEIDQRRGYLQEQLWSQDGTLGPQKNENSVINKVTRRFLVPLGPLGYTLQLMVLILAISSW